MSKKRNFRSAAFTPGSFISIGSATITEIAAQFPFSWLLLDMEHGGFYESNLTEHLRILQPTPIAAIVRVPATDPVLIAKVLDAGADGVMIPHVVSAAQLEECKKMMYYLPEGKRGFSSSVRQFAYGTQVPVDLSTIEKPLLFAQIEDGDAVRKADEIAAVPGVDVLFVGPADLQLSLKHDADKSVDYTQALHLVQQAAEKNSVKAGILVRDMGMVNGLRTSGFSCIAVQSDTGILRNGYTAVFQGL